MSWSKPKIEAEKASIRKWLDSIEGTPKARLRELLREIKSQLHATDDDLQLRTFLCIVFALAHHLRQGGLPAKEVQWLGYVGDTLLRLHGIENSRSRVAFLFGDLHLMLSQIYWKEGRQWDATWEQLLAKTQESSSGDSKSGTLLALASRAFRLGQLENALRWIEEAQTQGLEGWWANQAQLKRLMVFRLQGRFSEAETLERSFLKSALLNESERREISWERLTRAAQQTGDLVALVHSTRRRAEHHDAEFAMEAFLWTRIVSSTRWMKQFPNFRKLVYSSQIKPSANDPLYQAIKTIEDCYDNQLSILRRLRDLGEVLGSLPKLINLNHELLVRAAALRWLIRVNAHDARGLVQAEYENLSLKITNGTSRDVLNAFPATAQSQAA